MVICQLYFLNHVSKRGKTMDKHTIEFWNMLDKLFETHEIIRDRPKGSAHPKYKNYIYPLDYGYLKGTVSSDGAGIDVWCGSSKDKNVCAIISSIDFLKEDSEIKILYACTPEEIQLIYEEHNRSDGMKGILSIR